MVWPFTSSGDGAENPSKRPELGSSLDEFLKNQSPAKYETASQSTETFHSTPTPAATKDDPKLDENGRPLYAQKSQFSDGRYDHIWKNYQPLHEVEAAGKTDQEKASDILADYKKRRGNIKSAAMENCSKELMAQWDCTNGSDWEKKVTMCREEGRQIGRCLVMQGRFLRALGYLSETGRPREVEEDIQLHADDLFRRMLQQEQEVELARKEGRKEPEFPAILSWQGAKVAANVPVKVPGQTLLEPDTPDDPALPVEVKHVGPAQVKSIKDTLRPLNPTERALERAAIAHDVRRATETAKTYDYLTQKHERDRQLRREAGTATLGDRIAGIFGR